MGTPSRGVPILVAPFSEIRRVLEEHNVGWLLGGPINPKVVAEVLLT